MTVDKITPVRRDGNCIPKDRPAGRITGLGTRGSPFRLCTAGTKTHRCGDHVKLDMLVLWYHGPPSRTTRKIIAMLRHNRYDPKWRWYNER